MSEVTVRLIYSGIGCSEGQRRTLAALGLRKIGRLRAYKDSPALRGMLRKVGHLIEVKIMPAKRGKAAP